MWNVICIKIKIHIQQFLIDLNGLEEISKKTNKVLFKKNLIKSILQLYSMLERSRSRIRSGMEDFFIELLF